MLSAPPNMYKYIYIYIVRCMHTCIYIYIYCIYILLLRKMDENGPLIYDVLKDGDLSTESTGVHWGPMGPLGPG